MVGYRVLHELSTRRQLNNSRIEKVLNQTGSKSVQVRKRLNQTRVRLLASLVLAGPSRVVVNNLGRVARLWLDEVHKAEDVVAGRRT